MQQANKKKTTLNKPNDPVFRSTFSEDIFDHKYSEVCGTWGALARQIVEDVCGPYLSKEVKDYIAWCIAQMKFIPGGRYLYYAGRPNRYWNNCYLLKAEEDTREDWAELSWKAERCLMVGGGIGVDYSVYREAGAKIARTGGRASGPIPKMQMINEIGRHVMQGGSRRSALYASLSWQHPDVMDFIHVKDWSTTLVPGTDLSLRDLKMRNFNWPCPLDMTNISVNYDDAWKDGDRLNVIFMNNVANALRHGEPGFSFNFGAQQNQTLRNACTEITSADDSDVCNLGSVNMSRIESIQEMYDVCYAATLFLYCGTLGADLPYDKVRQVRERNRRLGLGLMGIHEWMLVHGGRYEMTPLLRTYLAQYRYASIKAAHDISYSMGLSMPVGLRAIAPTGTIGILAGTTTGIEPVFAVAYKRRYLKGSSDWHYQYVVDSTAKFLIEERGVDPDKIETAYDLSLDYERRIKFQAEVQAYVDHAISSTINLPSWGSSWNTPDGIKPFAETLAKYAPQLRGFTCYPDGARGGQPLTPVDYRDAKDSEGIEYQEATHDVCDITGKGGSCGV